LRQAGFPASLDYRRQFNSFNVTYISSLDVTHSIQRFLPNITLGIPLNEFFFIHNY